MHHYLGYGLKDTDVAGSDIIRLYKKYNATQYADIVDDVEEDDVLDEVIYDIESQTTLAEYICGIINREEGSEIVSFYNTAEQSALYYAPVEFPEETSERAKRVRSRADFVKMLERYLPASAKSADRLWLVYCDDYEYIENS